MSNWAPPEPADRAQDGELVTIFTPAQSAMRLGALLVAWLAIGFLYSWAASIFLTGLLFFIFLHECGHFFTARWTGMKATQFFLGFGPNIWSFRRGEVEYGLKAIPLGAFVRIIGMHNLEEVDPADEGRAYRQKSYLRRLLVVSAGSLTHFIAAFVLLAVVLAGWGRPDPTRWAIVDVSVGSPAQAAGLQPGDRIISVDGQAVVTFDDTTSVIRANPGKTVALAVDRSSGPVSLQVVLADMHPITNEAVGYLGVGSEDELVRESAVNVVPEAGKAWLGQAKLTFVGIKQVFGPGGLREYVDTIAGRRDNTDKRMLSPVGAAKVGALACRDAASCLGLLAAVNVFIGIFNLFPLLPFDGGHVAIATYERIRSRKGRRYFADVGKMLPVTYVLVAVLLLLTLGNLYLDSTRSIGG